MQLVFIRHWPLCEAAVGSPPGCGATKLAPLMQEVIIATLQRAEALTALDPRSPPLGLPPGAPSTAIMHLLQSKILLFSFYLFLLLPQIVIHERTDSDLRALQKDVKLHDCGVNSGAHSLLEKLASLVEATTAAAGEAPSHAAVVQAAALQPPRVAREVTSVLLRTARALQNSRFYLVRPHCTKNALHCLICHFMVVAHIACIT